MPVYKQYVIVQVSFFSIIFNRIWKQNTASAQMVIRITPDMNVIFAKNGFRFKELDLVIPTTANW